MGDSKPFLQKPQMNQEIDDDEERNSIDSAPCLLCALVVDFDRINFVLCLVQVFTVRDCEKADSLTESFRASKKSTQSSTEIILGYDIFSLVTNKLDLSSSKI